MRHQAIKKINRKYFLTALKWTGLTILAILAVVGSIDTIIFIIAVNAGWLNL